MYAGIKDSYNGLSDEEKHCGMSKEHFFCEPFGYLLLKCPSDEGTPAM
jgi:hypothetical protein